MKKPTVGVFFGSRSAEHDVSIVTAIAAIIKPLKLSKEYEVVPVYIAKDGRWFSDDVLADIATYSSGKIDAYLSKAKPVKLIFDNGLVLQKGKRKQTRIDIAFPATHGTHGEDGELMAIFEMASVPFVGCGVEASAIAMDKVLSKQVTTSAGIPTTPWIWLKPKDMKTVASMVKTAQLEYPLFVKPARLGSSIGITRVTNDTELQNAVEVAFYYDDKIIVEQGVANLIEVTLPIMGNELPEPALLERPLVNSEEFFDFDTKYIGGGKKGGSKNERGAQGYSEVPAKLDKALYDKAQQTALNVYQTVGCEGIARVDLLIDSKSGEVYFNEINPLPGSLYAHNWNKVGVSNIELTKKLIGFGMQRWEKSQKRATTFSTNFLKQF